MFGGFSTVLADQYVDGYYKSNGTYVNGYWRSSPDGNPYNNFSYPGNTNPYTGVTAGGNASTYLNNYYNNESSTGFTLPRYSPSYTIPSYSPINSLFGAGSSLPSYTPKYSGYSGYSGLDSDFIYKEIKGGWTSYGITYCDSDYYEKGDKCVKQPKNGYVVAGTLYCDSGYIEKSGKCEEPKNGEMIGSTLYCDDGFFVLKNSCVTLERICKAEFGGKSVPSGEDACTCKGGFKWNSKQTECVKDRSKTSSTKSSN